MVKTDFVVMTIKNEESRESQFSGLRLLGANVILTATISQVQFPLKPDQTRFGMRISSKLNLNNVSVSSCIGTTFCHHLPPVHPP